MTSVSKQGKALKRFLQGKDPRRRTPSMRFRQQATNESSDNANNGLIGSEISKDLVSSLHIDQYTQVSVLMTTLRRCLFGHYS